MKNISIIIPILQKLNWGTKQLIYLPNVARQQVVEPACEFSDPGATV